MKGYLEREMADAMKTYEARQRADEAEYPSRKARRRAWVEATAAHDLAICWYQEAVRELAFLVEDGTLSMDDPNLPEDWK